jgi:hypothetical protein
MPTIEGKEAGIWIDDYVKNAGEHAGVAKAARALVKAAVKGAEEYVNPWKIRHSIRTDPCAASWSVKTM